MIIILVVSRYRSASSNKIKIMRFYQFLAPKMLRDINFIKLISSHKRHDFIGDCV